MKTLIIILTSVVLLTSCGNKSEVYCAKSQLRYTDPSPSTSPLIAKKNFINQNTKRSKNGLIIIPPKLSSLY